MVRRFKFALFIGRLVLLVHNDNAKICDLGKESRTRTDDDIDLASTNALPFIIALTNAQLAMNDRHASGETTRHALYSLGGQGNFRHQHNTAFALSDQRSEGLQIDLCLAATGHAMQQDRLGYLALLAAPTGLKNAGQGIALI